MKKKARGKIVAHPDAEQLDGTETAMVWQKEGRKNGDKEAETKGRVGLNHDNSRERTFYKTGFGQPRAKGGRGGDTYGPSRKGAAQQSQCVTRHLRIRRQGRKRGNIKE